MFNASHGVEGSPGLNPPQWPQMTASERDSTNNHTQRGPGWCVYTCECRGRATHRLLRNPIHVHGVGAGAGGLDTWGVNRVIREGKKRIAKKYMKNK